MRVTIVVPTIREQSIREFLERWDRELQDHTLIIVEDNPERSFNIARHNVLHYCWDDVDKELGNASWIIPRRTDCIRSFGYYKAYQLGADVIITLDDDCYPGSNSPFVKTHLEALATPARSVVWVSTVKGAMPRGMPYRNLERSVECVINHGLWTKVPDFDAITQLVNLRLNLEFDGVNQVIPNGMYFPMCGMNLAFKRKMVPAMYFLLMGQGWPFDRFGDIWAGLFVKKICDHLNLGVRSGEPVVEHQRASDVWVNLRKEVPGYEVNEVLWQAIDSVVLTKETVKECYRELAEKLPLGGEYWDNVRRAMIVWSELFGE